MIQTQHVIDTLKPEVVEEYLGRLNFSVSYNGETETLYVNVIQAVDLPVRDFIGRYWFYFYSKHSNTSGTSDPYVRVFLLDQPSSFQQTKVHSRNLNPKFQQVLTIQGKPYTTCGWTININKLQQKKSYNPPA